MSQYFPENKNNLHKTSPDWQEMSIISALVLVWGQMLPKWAVAYQLFEYNSLKMLILTL